MQIDYKRPERSTQERIALTKRCIQDNTKASKHLVAALDAIGSNNRKLANPITTPMYKQAVRDVATAIKDLNKLNTQYNDFTIDYSKINYLEM